MDALIVSPSAIRVGAHTRITAVAHDPDGEELFPIWENLDGAGEITADGSNGLYAAPETPGIYRVRVSVVDPQDADLCAETAQRYGRDDCSRDVEVEVYGSDDPRWNDDHPPVVLALNSSILTVSSGALPHLTAQTEEVDGDPLTYIWTSTFARGGFVGPDGNLHAAIATDQSEMDFEVSEQCCAGIHSILVTASDPAEQVGRAWVGISVLGVTGP